MRLGLINRITPRGQELAAALRTAEELAAVPASGVVAVKKAFNRALVEQARLEGLI